MSKETTNTETGRSPFLPLLLMAGSILLFFCAQLWSALFQDRPILQQQEAQLAQLDARAGILSKLNDNLRLNLLELSKTDLDAQNLVQKFGIRYNVPQGSLPAPTLPAPAASAPAPKK